MFWIFVAAGAFVGVAFQELSCLMSFLIGCVCHFPKVNRKSLIKNIVGEAQGPWETLRAVAGSTLTIYGSDSMGFMFLCPYYTVLVMYRHCTGRYQCLNNFKHCLNGIQDDLNTSQNDCNTSQDDLNTCFL